MKEIIKRIDNIRGTIDSAFETGKLDFDKISSELTEIGDTLSALNKNAESELADKPRKPGNPTLLHREIKIEDYI